MNSFESDYLVLLRRQVDEEIQYLVRAGHDSRKIDIPCMFCIDTRKGYYTCYRLNQLREFQSSIVSSQVNQGRQAAQRNRIGYETVSNALGIPLPRTLDKGNLPLMFPELKPLS